MRHLVPPDAGEDMNEGETDEEDEQDEKKEHQPRVQRPSISYMSNVHKYQKILTFSECSNLFYLKHIK